MSNELWGTGYPVRGVAVLVDTTHNLVTSPVFSPPVLATLRLILAVYALFAVLFELIWEALKTDDAKSFFSYFTHLSYIGLVAYFWASAVQTIAFVRSGCREYPLQRWSRFLQFLHLLLYSTITVFPIIVTVVFWVLLSGSTTLSTRFSAWSNISIHALNTAFALFEIFLTNVPPPPWLHLPLLIVLLGGYLGVAYITHITQGFYTYSFLDPHKEQGLLAAYFLGIAAGAFVVFILVHLACRLRAWLAARYSSSYKNHDRVDGDVPLEAIDDWERIERTDV